MRTRAKALTVAAAMVTTFAILPTLGAAAAEPLEDGSYDVVIGEQTYTVDVAEGVATVEGAEGVDFRFEYDPDSERVLDEFDVAVDGVVYEVEVDDDGTIKVTEDEVEEPAEEEADEGGADAQDDDSEEEIDGDLEALDEGEVDDELNDQDDVEDGAHGQVVSTVAQCAPRGWQAREAGLPNHGVFVSAAARGEEVDFEVDGETHTVELADQDGADAFCELADELLAAAENDADDADDAETAASDDGDVVGERGRGKDGERGNGKGRANAPGQLKKNG